MSDEDAEIAIHLASKVFRWIQLDRSNSNGEKKEQLLEYILDKTRRSKALRNELYLQLMKQTRFIRDPFVENNTWDLWSRIAKRRACSKVRLFSKVLRKYRQDILRFVLDYWKSVVLNNRNSCYARWMALQLLQSQRSKQKETDPFVLSRIYSCCATIQFGELCAEIRYDDCSKVSDVILQSAWAIGLRNYGTLDLHLLEDQKWTKLDPSLQFGQNNALERQGNKNTKFVLRSRLLKLDETHLSDSTLVQLMYHQANAEFLSGTIPLAEENIVHLMNLQIQAERRNWLFLDEKELRSHLLRTLPAKVTKHFSKLLYSVV